jgi:hypothetical protein
MDKDEPNIEVKFIYLTGLAGKYQWREFPVVITGKYHPGKYSKF